MTNRLPGLMNGIKHQALVLLALLGLVLAFLVLGPSQASAAGPSQSVDDQLVSYCKSKASKKLDAACTDKNMQRVRNVASGDCKDKKTAGDKASCIVKEGKGYIAKALSTKPKTAKAFEKELEAVLKSTGRDPSRTADSTSLDEICEGGKCRDSAADPTVNCSKQGCDFITKYINPTINMLSLAFGLIAAISIIAGAIMYMSSNGDPQKVTNAKKRITNTIIALLAYIFLYAFLQFLVPGGIFNK